MPSDFYPVHIYFLLVAFITLVTLALSGLFPPHKEAPAKFDPYESGIKTETHLLSKRFPLRHYLVALVFLVFDIEVVFLYPWVAVAKEIGPFAFFEMLFFVAALFVGYLYVWKKGALEWQ